MVREWITLLYLAHHRFRGNDSHRRFQVYQGYLVLDYLIEQGVNVQNTRVLDLGCGNGGYSYVIGHCVSPGTGREALKAPMPTGACTH